MRVVLVLTCVSACSFAFVKEPTDAMLTRREPATCTTSRALPVVDLAIGAALGALVFTTTYAAIEEFNDECAPGRCYRPWGPALLGSFLARQGWAPKTIAGALTAVGAGLAWKGDGSTIRSVGAGTMSAAGSQLALMVIDDRDKKVAAIAAPKPKNADGLPPGALENAFDRARERLALTAGGYDGG